MTAAEAITAFATAHSLTIDAVFVPWSMSRNAGNNQPSLNWKITLKKNDKPILTTDYMQGCAHCPSYKQGSRKWEDAQVVKKECETGQYRMRPILPSLPDFLACIVLDSEAIDYPTFEDYAANLGIDPDSRKGEASYRQCIETALKLRAAMGEDGLQELRTLCADW